MEHTVAKCAATCERAWHWLSRVFRTCVCIYVIKKRELKLREEERWVLRGGIICGAKGNLYVRTGIIYVYTLTCTTGIHTKFVCERLWR